MKQKTYKQKLDSIVELVDYIIKCDETTSREEIAIIILSILGISEIDIKPPKYKGVKK